MAVLCVFGDSTAWGAWDIEKGGWANRLWLFFAEHDTDIDLYNLSISGGTTDTILTRFELEAAVREADMLIFQCGGNDAAYDTNSNYLVAPEQFKNNIEEIIKRAKVITKKIICIGFDIVDEQKTNPVPWAEVFYTNENIKKYNVIMKEVCVQQNVLYFDILNLLESKDFYDGLHPNAEGHRKIFETIKDFMAANHFFTL